MKRLLFIMGMLLICTLSWAKPKPATKTYTAACPKVWEATKVVVQGNYDVLSLNDQAQTGSFTTGSAWTGVRPLTFTLSANAETCTVSVTGHFSGLIHNDKGDFFKRIQDTLITKRDGEGK
jgi:hypothetical protein